ncbi:MAG TPA: tetratricopeptide repeat protein [Thermodesulfobacteriota bacterium]|nr:tetratricopeptide repeat protein [Thermodesulfobacteriota bacterium]
MNIKKQLLFIVAVFLFSSCTGIGILPGARSEFDRGLSFFNRGQYEEAIPYFREATEIDPDYADAYLYLGRSYINLGRWSEAIPPLRTAYRLSPGKTREEVGSILIDALLGGALLQFQRGNYENSISFLREVFELDPQSTRARSQLATVLVAFGGELLSNGRIERAIDIYTEALTLSPRNADAYVGLARAFFRGGEFFKALQAARSALEIEPTNREARFLLNEIQK